MPIVKIHVLEGRYDESRLGGISRAVQDALEGLTEIAMFPLPPDDGKPADVGFSENTAVAAASLTVTLTPPTLMLPFRADKVLLAATE